MHDRAFSHQETIISNVQRTRLCRAAERCKRLPKKGQFGGQDCRGGVSQGLGWSRDLKPEETLGSRQAPVFPQQPINPSIASPLLPVT